jgi:hypothetical protein
MTNNDHGKAKDSDVMKRISNVRGGGGGGGSEGDEGEEVFKLAPFNPSSDQIQQKALEMLNLKSNDILFDIGCGDSRLLCFAATNTPGLRCVGIEIDEIYVTRGRDRVKSSKLESRIDIRLEDATKISIIPTNDDDDDDDDDDASIPTTATTTTNIPTTKSCDKNGEDNNDTNEGSKQKSISDLTLLDDATVLYLFVLPKGIVKLMPILQSLADKRVREGKRFRMLSYMFKIHDWEPKIVDKTAKGGCPVYYYEFGPTK